MRGSCNWLVSLNDYTAIAMVWHDTPFVTAADMLTRELLVGSNAPASDTTVWPLLLNALIGSKVKLVKGYAGTTGITLAMERGEVQGMIGDDWASVKSNKAEWLREKKIRILMQMTASRHADLPDVPVAGEFAKDEDKRRVLELFVLRQKYGRPFLAPPGTPAPVVAAYRDAFDKLVHDPDLHARGRARAAHHQGSIRRGGDGARQPHPRQSEAGHRGGERAAAKLLGIVVD